MARSFKVRDVPDDVYLELRVRAAALGVSVSEYVLGVLAESADSVGRRSNAEVLQRAQSRGGGASGEDIVAVIRRARDAV